MRSSFPRRDVLKHSIALAGLAAFAPRPAAARTQPAAGGDPFFPGFTTTKVKTSGAEIHVLHAGSGPPLLLLHGAPQTHISWRLVAPELAKSHTVDRPRPARLRRQQQAARRREPRQLLQARDGARSGRGDEALRLRPVPGRRPRPRRTRRASAGARSRRQGHAAGGARHRADALPLHARHASSSSRPTSTGSTTSAPRPVRRTSSRSSTTQQAAKATDRRCSASTCASTATRPTSTGCAKTTAPARRSTSRTTPPIWTRRSPARCWRCGAPKRRWDASSTCWRSGGSGRRR